MFLRFDRSFEVGSGVFLVFTGGITLGGITV